MTIPDEEAAPSAITNHSAHPGHKLKRVADDGQLFICDGCKEPGVGARYTCEREQSCDFDLHTCCAVAPDTLTHPAFGADRVFLFLQEPEPPRAGTGGGRYCAAAACGQLVRGFVYHCFDDDEGIDLHPCCARLPEHAIIRDEGRVSALGKVAPASRQRETSDDDNRSQKVHCPSAARHRRWDGRKAGVQDPTPENTQLVNNRVFGLRRQEVSRPGDTSGDWNRGREGAPAARHRWWSWKR